MGPWIGRVVKLQTWAGWTTCVGQTNIGCPSIPATRWFNDTGLRIWRQLKNRCRRGRDNYYGIVNGVTPNPTCFHGTQNTAEYVGQRSSIYRPCNGIRVISWLTKLGQKDYGLNLLGEQPCMLCATRHVQPRSMADLDSGQGRLAT